MSLVYHEWNSIKDFSDFGISSLSSVKPVKKSPLKILPVHPAIFMTFDVVNRYVNGRNLFEFYDDKYKYVIKNLQGNKDEFRDNFCMILDKFFNTTNVVFTEKVSNKYGIEWKFLMNGSTLNDSLFNRESKFINLRDFNEYIDENENVSTLAYLILYFLKDKTLRTSREQFTKAIENYAEEMATMINEQENENKNDKINRFSRNDKSNMDNPDGDPYPAFQEFSEIRTDNAEVEELRRDLDELRSSYAKDVSLLKNNLNQLAQVCKMMKREIDELKGKVTMSNDANESFTFNMFGY